MHLAPVQYEEKRYRESVKTSRHGLRSGSRCYCTVTTTGMLRATLPELAVTRIVWVLGCITGAVDLPEQPVSRLRDVIVPTTAIRQSDLSARRLRRNHSSCSGSSTAAMCRSKPSAWCLRR